MAPSAMPTSTNTVRANGTGTVRGRPAMAATATATTEPEINPAGMPVELTAMPPAAPIARASAVRRTRVRSNGTGLGFIATVGPPDRFGVLAMTFRPLIRPLIQSTGPPLGLGGPVHYNDRREER